MPEKVIGLEACSVWIPDHAPLVPNLVAVLGLTHNHGTESDPDVKGYNTPAGRGLAHISVSVDDIVSACDRFEKLGVPFKKRLTDGRVKDIAFLL